MTTSTLTKLAPTQVELEIPISTAELQAAEERAFRKLAKNAKVPGFRPGKIPRKVFEQAYGSDSISSQAMEDLVPEAYGRAIREHSLEPVDRPKMELLPEESGKPTRIKAIVDVRPQIELKAYKGLKLTSDPVAISGEDVDRSLQALARDRAALIPVDRAAKLGDVVQLDYEGKIEGTAFEGGTAQGQMTELSDERFIPGFATGIAGMTIGQTKEVEAKFPDDYQKEDLAGKTATFTVTLHEVKEHELPNIDDEFAKSVSQNQTIDELKADIRKRLESVAQAKSRRALGNQMMEHLIAEYDFALPDVMVEREIESMLSDAGGQASRIGMNFEDYLKAVNKTEDDLRAEFRGDAQTRVRGTLVLEAIAKAENINATPADVAAELQGLAEQYGRPVEQIRSALGNNVLSLMDGIVRSKTVEYLLEQASIEGATQSAPA
ncbi:MAG: trigger factor [Candidatus Baltobacteraceae bacterium]